MMNNEKTEAVLIDI